jgi:DNA-binding NarL/FixJ family response regulator
MSDQPALPKIRVAIVDDHPIYRLGLATVLNSRSDTESSWTADNAADAYRLSQEDPPDVILMDADLGDGGDSLSVIRSIRNASPEVKVVVITALGYPEYEALARHVGASLFLTKDLPIDVMIARLTEALAPELQESARRPDKEDRPALTRRESEVLLEIRSGRTNREIAKRLGVSTSTVNKHVHQVLSKLKVRNRAHAATFKGPIGRTPGSGRND